MSKFLFDKTIRQVGIPNTGFPSENNNCNNRPRRYRMTNALNFRFLVIAIFFGFSFLAQSQEVPDDPKDIPTEEDKIYYTCETYTDSGEYKLSAVLNFTLDSYNGVLEVIWVNESTYGELPRLRHGATLNATRVKAGKQGRTPVFIIESLNARTGNGVKVIVPMKADVYGDTMGEIHVNGSSFEAKCTVEIDTY